MEYGQPEIGPTKDTRKTVAESPEPGFRVLRCKSSDGEEVIWTEEIRKESSDQGNESFETILQEGGKVDVERGII
jgi:hypothetical protein